MRSYKELSIRYLKSKKGRTLTVIFGIVISVALITGVFSLVDSFKGKMIERYELTSKSYADLGGVKGSDVSKIVNNVKLEKAAFSTGIGTIEKYDKNADYNTVVSAISLDGIYLRSYENVICEGKVPSKVGEIIVSKEYLKKNNKKIGDTVTINFKDIHNGKEKEIKGTIVAAENDPLITYIVDESFIEPNSKYLLSLRYKNVKDTVESVEDIRKDFGISERQVDGEDSQYININEDYITLLGENIGDGKFELIETLQYILIILVVISSVGLIYNGFMISVNDRNKEFSLLRAVGISKKQVKKIVLKEALIIGVVGIIIGILLGILGVYILLKVVTMINIFGLGKVEFAISLNSIIGSIIISIITIGISIFIPLRRLSEVTPVDGMKNTFVNNEKIKVSKKNGIFTRIFGSPGKIANKNLRRNKGRFKAVVLGFSLSIFIFVSFYSFTEIANSAMLVQDSVSKYEIQTNSNSDIGKIKMIDGVKNVYTEYEIGSKANSNHALNIDECKIKGNDILTDKFKNITSQDFSYTVYNTDSKAVKEEIVRNSKLDENKLKSGVVIQNKAIVLEGNKKVLVDITNYKVGDKINIELKINKTNNEGEGEEKTILLKDIEIVGIVEEGVKASKEWVNSPVIYMGDDLFNKVINNLGGERSGRNTKVVPENEMFAEKVFTELDTNRNEYKVTYLISQDENQRQWSKMMLVYKIGVYGFLILITLITLTNIITSVTSSIEDRRKEIALLRSIGTSKKFIKKMIFIENLNYYLYSIVIGGLLGIASSGVITKGFASMYEGIYVFPIKPLIISSIILLIFVLAISKYSINKLCKNSIVEEIREE
ncbi:MAG: ABC transporter permease [Clostridium sp.]|uniref:ABC transporter permease n=1 Tax=Clostridium sp. TaxID=1506 RepID=UPI002FCAD271